MSFTNWLRNLQSFCRLGTTSRKSRRAARSGPAKRFRLQLETLEGRVLPSFSPAMFYPVGGNPQAVLTADFNGDGRLDFAVVNGSNYVSVLLGNSDGTFQPAQNSATGAGSISLAVGDFNADGKLDLATANGGDLSVLLGNGNGTFQAPTNIGIGSNPASVAVGDFNSDGKLDLAVASINFPSDENTGFIYENVLLGNGDGSFGAPWTSAIREYPISASVAVGDFNGDGKLDVATAVNTWFESVVTVALGTGTGALGGPSSFTIADYPQSVAAGDVNGDSKLDLVTANSGGNVSVLLGNGLGSFGAAQNYAAGLQPRSVAMADFNGDGKVDLVTANSGSSTVSVLLGTGTGLFRSPVNAITGTGPLGVAVGDFNGDGRADAATANSSSNNVSVLLNDGSWPVTDTPSITINDVSVREGNTGTVNATFTVSLSAAYGQPVTVNFAAADGSATVTGGDFQASSGTLTFAPGVTSQTVTVLVNGDRLAEYSESFLLVLSNPTNAYFADANGVGTILDDEPTVSLATTYVSGLEGNSGTTPFTFTVTLSAAYDAPVTVDYATADLTPDEEYWYGLTAATAGLDYTATSGTLTIPAGQTSGTITVLITGDRLGESDESFFLSLSNPTSAHLDYNYSGGLGTIVDDEPRVSIGGASALEGNSGTKALTFTVTLSTASDAPVTVSFATADISATAGSDYQAASGTLTIPTGQTSGTITVLVSGDRFGESNETFVINLSNPTNAIIADGQAVGTITDDEPRISISDVTKAEGRKGKTTLFTFTVTLSAAYDQAVTMSFRTVNGTATTSNGDYVAKTGTLTFNPGETTKTITIAVKGDSKKEANETFYLDLFGNSGNSLFTKNRGLGTILTDD